MIGTRHTFVSYFAFAVDTIMKVLLREGVARGPLELVMLTGQRIRRLERRFNALLAMWRAGTLAVVVVREEGTPHPGPPGQALGQASVPPQGGREKTPHPGPLPQGERGKKAWGFPRGRGWISRLLAPVTGPHCVGTLCLAWEEPEMAEFYAAAPQLGKILRPLAHMIGAPLPVWLRLPKRVRVRRNNPSPRLWSASRPKPTRGEGEGEMIVPNRRLPAREQAEDAMRRSEASGKPIDLRKFSAEAFGWWAHPPRDGNCPPPKIGYGGRLRPLPKDDKPPRDEEWDGGRCARIVPVWKR
jgi:hypothetical protein